MAQDKLSLDDQALETRLTLARQAARDAGRSTLEYFRSDRFTVQRKNDDSPVTIADHQAERILREQIEAQFPDDAIVGEEFGQREGGSGYRWILDPIDGTTSFISGVPLYGTLVGVEYGQRSMAGVIYIPALDEVCLCGGWQWRLVLAGQQRAAGGARIVVREPRRRAVRHFSGRLVRETGRLASVPRPAASRLHHAGPGATVTATCWWPRGEPR